MAHDDEDRWAEWCDYCPHYMAEHHDQGCGATDWTTDEEAPCDCTASR